MTNGVLIAGDAATAQRKEQSEAKQTDMQTREREREREADAEAQTNFRHAAKKKQSTWNQLLQ
jgi:hypothetical protein